MAAQRIRAALLVVGVLGLAGCVAQLPYATPPYPAPPPDKVEQRPLPPLSEEQLVWQPGHWDWTGGGYEWQPGRYVPLGGHSTNWMPGWWDRDAAGVWVWRPPHWL